MTTLDSATATATATAPVAGVGAAPAVAPPAFRAAMSRFAAGVTVVTTRDEQHRPYGFTASSFCSVSLDPPLVLVCLARTANSFPVFARSPRFAVSILQAHHVELAERFAANCSCSSSPSGPPS